LGTNYDNVLDRQHKGRGHAPRNIGEANGMSKISDADVALIKSINLPLKRTSELFGISQAAVSMIRNNLRRSKKKCLV
jgi:hypothetical protein